MKILISEFKKNRPWLDVDNGELVSVIKRNLKSVTIDWMYQIDDFSTILEKIDDYTLIFIHIEHQSMNYAMLNLKKMKKYEHKIIIYGYGVLFSNDLRTFQFSICNDDIHDVIKVASNILLTQLYYDENELEASDFSDLSLITIENYPIRYSKGCENSCPYCEKSLENKKIYKEQKTFEKELCVAIERYGAKSLTFVDSSLGICKSPKI